MISNIRQSDNSSSMLLSLKSCDKWLRCWYNMSKRTWVPGSPSISQFLSVTGSSWLVYCILYHKLFSPEALLLIQPFCLPTLFVPLPSGCCTYFCCLPSHSFHTAQSVHSGLSQVSSSLTMLSLSSMLNLTMLKSSTIARNSHVFSFLFLSCIHVQSLKTAVNIQPSTKVNNNINAIWAIKSPSPLEWREAKHLAFTKVHKMPSMTWYCRSICSRNGKYSKNYKFPTVLLL